MPGEESTLLADLGDAAFADASATDRNRDCILCARVDRDNGKKRCAQYSDLCAECQNPTCDVISKYEIVSGIGRRAGMGNDGVCDATARQRERQRKLLTRRRKLR